MAVEEHSSQQLPIAQLYCAAVQSHNITILLRQSAIYHFKTADEKLAQLEI